jgi:hypothetical protein
LLQRGGGKLAHIGWNQTHPGKWQKMFRKMFEHLFMQKCSDGNKYYFSEHFFQLWNDIANIQKIARWYKVYIGGISKPKKNKKREP